MKSLKKSIIIIITLIFILILLINQQVLAKNNTISIQKREYSEDFKKWLELSDEEKSKVIQPRIYDAKNTSNISKNPLYKARMLTANVAKTFNLKNIIPDNLVIRNQMQTNTCWAFATLSSLETNLALANRNANTNTSKVYDFSERHMEYATSKEFIDEDNPIGYNRKVGDGGNWYYAQSYLTNGTGAIDENDMKFENNEDLIALSLIQNKTVTSQVYDTIEFEDYRLASEDKKVEIMNQIKQHIQNYGSVYASMHGDSSTSTIFPCYNNETSAKYCSNSIMHKSDHAVSIIGWDDDFPIESFNEESQPESKGAWIIRNSWGEKEEYKLQELKEILLKELQDAGYGSTFDNVSKITDDMIKRLGFTIDGENAYMEIGDHGLMYVSYEDSNISKTLCGIVKAGNDIDYENIYQYDEYYPASGIRLFSNKIMLCNVFNRNNKSSKEYLTQVSLYAPETYTCKVYVNPTGDGKTQSELKQIQLKDGNSEKFNTGYHTLEFAKPVEITGDKFAVVIEIEGTESTLDLSLEAPVDDVEQWDVVQVEKGKCFLATGNDLSNCQWQDLGQLSTSQMGSGLPNGDSTIKAFTVSKIYDNTLQKIAITNAPNKTDYFEGDNFQKEGMQVTAYYNSKNNSTVILSDTDYSITNGTNLTKGQKSVTITYRDKSVEQTINVQENSVTELKITKEPTKTSYKEGQNFDPAGMTVEATYKNGTKKTITDYKIENGNNLATNQTEVIISYGGQTVTQTITVTPNPLVEIKITKAPNKVNYVVGQNFDPTGMIVTGKYQDGDEQEITGYTIEDGTDLKKEQTYVTIKYKEKTITQEITVVEKAITQISVEKQPSKVKYIQNKENLDLTGGIIKVTYNDDTTENISMTSDEVSVSGFNNEKIGNITITITYQNKTTQLKVEIIEEKKAVNSNLDNIESNVKKVQAYYFTNKSENNYTLINVEIDKISRNMDNDTVEYYYYLSSNPNEQNISGWTKITEKQSDSNKLQFTIDSRKMTNYNEIASEDVVYLYIKEVTINGADQSVVVSKPMKLETDKKIETYVDNAKKENLQSSNTGTDKSNENDNTVAGGRLPQTGITVTILVLAIIMTGVGTFLYIKYKILSKYIK